MDWRLIVIALAALAAVAFTIVWSRRVVEGGDRTDAGHTLSSLRPGASLGPGEMVVYHYRVSSRFGEFVRIRVAEGQVTVVGRRLPLGMYYFFVGLQLALWSGALAIIFAGIVLLSWEIVVLGIVVFVLFLVASSMMAGGLWETQGAAAMQTPGGFDRVVFPLASVRDVRRTGGWSRRGMRVVIWPFVKGVDAVVAPNEVSFEAPDPITGRYVVYAVHAYSPEEADLLAAQLQGAEAS